MTTYYSIFINDSAVPVVANCPIETIDKAKMVYPESCFYFIYHDIKISININNK